VREASHKRTYFKERAQKLDETMTARVLNSPAREDIAVRLEEQLIVEYYSR